MSDIKTRCTTISARKAAYMGDAYLDTFLGLDVVADTDTYGPVVGKITGWWHPTGNPIITLDNGQTFRGTRALTIVTNAADL
jgi:hypothetical protein